MPLDETEYFLERAFTEREMAKVAKHPNAVAAHEELAQQYDALIKERTRPTFHAVMSPRISAAT